MLLEVELPHRGALARMVNKILRTDAYTDDVLQQTHLDAYTWGQAHPDTEIRNVRGFLFSLARARAVDEHREHVREWQMTRLVKQGIDWIAPSPEDISLMVERADARLSKLTDRQWDVVYLYLRGRYTNKQIAALLRVSPAAITQTLRRAIRRLEDE